jgi:hypothetical protein
MPGSSTTPGHMGTRAFAPIRVAFHNADGVGSRDSTLSRLIGWPMHSPADASPTPSREPAHGSGPMRFATPSSWRTFTTYSLPVSPAHRREFIALFGGAVPWPITGCAQGSAITTIGYLSTRSPGEAKYVTDAFIRGLNEGGYVEGRNLAIEYRWAELQYDRLSALASDLVRRQVMVIAKLPPGRPWVQESAARLASCVRDTHDVRSTG